MKTIDSTSVGRRVARWTSLACVVVVAALAARALPLNALIAEVDALRVRERRAPNLASALRSWLISSIRE